MRSTKRGGFALRLRDRFAFVSFGPCCDVDLGLSPDIVGTLGATAIRENIPQKTLYRCVLPGKSGSTWAPWWQDHETVYFCRIRRNTTAMLLLVLYCGFYLSGLLIARWLTYPRQALVSGIAVASAALVAALTLWLLTQPPFIEPWLAIAMVGTIAIPALMMGLGLLAGWLLRHKGWSVITVGTAAVVPIATVLLALLGL